MSDDSAESTSSGRPIPVLWALVPVLGLIGLLVLFFLVLPKSYEGFGLEGHLPLLLGACVAGGVAKLHGWRWSELEKGISHAIRTAMPAILILFVIGVLMGVWITSGVVPAMIVWGLDLLAPSVFLPASCAVASVVSLVTGSSWSTAGTVGLALIGIGQTMGVPLEYTAGAVISGAYFGDKMSPMSETTNLAPAMAGADLFVHIRNMIWTAGPSWVIAMIVYVFMGLSLDAGPSAGEVEQIQNLLNEKFNPSLVHLLPPLTVLVLVMRKAPALPSLLAGAFAALVIGLIQGAALPELLTSAMNGYKPDIGDAVVDKLLERGGMSSVSGTVLLILCAMSFGGIMERTGQLRVLATAVLRRAESSRSLVVTTVLTCVGLNIIAADQYISIVVPGRMYAEAYAERGLAPRNLSRALEDGGTISSPLVPWNSCGDYMSRTLGVGVGAYMPFAVFNWVNPIVAIVLALLGKGIHPLNADNPAATPVNPEADPTES